MASLHPAGPANDQSVPFGDPNGELDDIELLHGISVALIGEKDRVELYGKIVDAAVAITRSQFGTMQLLMPDGDPSGHGGELSLLCSRGLSAADREVWRWVSPKAYSSCTAALKAGERAIIPDFELWDEIQGTPDLDAFRRAGIRSAQTTPLVTRDGALLGMISTHWNVPHTPTERDLRLLDIVARQAADLLERTTAEEALRAREQELDQKVLALRESDDLQQMLTGELSHRVKNMLATVQAIASQTLRHADDPAEFVKSFGGRIQSMARVHSQLSTNEWKGTPLHDVVRDQMRLGPVDEAQILASGPPMHLDAATVPKMAMILHELGTNSLKYGALSKPEGSVAITWTTAVGQLRVEWVEHGGPVVDGPIRRGFGTRLIESSVIGAGGEARMKAEPGGVRWDIVMPLPIDTAAEKDAADAVVARVVPANARVGGPGSQPLAGKRILVVEDEPLLAMDIAGQLEDAGAHVVGPAASEAGALGMIEQYRFDAALLDANLDGLPVDTIAAALARAKVPFVFVSGYDRDSLPDEFGDIELLPKPFDPRQLLDVTERLVS